jgi:uncharacterized RDD family membrane protein YckC
LSTTSHTAEFAENAEALPGWKQELSARLTAHRTRRRGSPDQQPSLPGMEQAAPDTRAALAARVAERYAKAPTYSEIIAAGAANAARAAEAAAQAAREAQQAAQAVSDVLLAGVESGLELERQADDAAAPATESEQYRVDPASLPAARRSPSVSSNSHARTVDAGFAVNPHPQIVDPFEEALIAPAQPLPARVLEFPRELVAARKARPRIAEGPLRDSGVAPEKEQLRIFEVEPETISHQPSPVQAAIDEAALPGWSSIRLDATPRNIEEEMSATVDKSRRAAQGRSGSRSAPLPSRAARQSASKRHTTRRSALLDDTLHVAPMLDRFLAAIVDIGLIVCAFSAFVGVFVACTAHPPSGKPALIAAGAVLVGFIALYQWLFFTYAESTPGMRYAKIALCTFDDENPGRKTLQHRVGALFLAALPLGLGFLWAFLDNDGLSWHDRMTRTYQRSYR